MNKIVSFFMMIITAISSFFGCGGGISEEVVDQPKAENFEPVTRFMVCSDTHIRGYDDPKLGRIRKAIDFCYDKAEKDSYYNNLDAVMFVGDLVNDGDKEQFDAFNETVHDAVKGETQILAVVAKNHDSWGETKKKSLKYCKEITGNDSDYHVVINGYHFIGISTSKYNVERYGIYQYAWLKKQLKIAAADDPTKPIFVNHHEHQKNTVYGSSNFEGWGVRYFRNLFNKYPQIVHFSGHSHYPLNDPRSIWQGNFTTVGTGAMSYMEVTVDKDRTLHPEGYDSAAQAWLVEIDANNQVRLRGFDVINGEWLCDYLVQNPSEPKKTVYTQFNQKAHSSAPKFDDEAKLTVKKDGDKYKVTVPAANSTDGNPIFVYRIFVFDKSGKQVHTEYTVNNYWTNDCFKSFDFSLDAKSGYTVKAVAENCYGMQSEALYEAIS